MTFNEIARRALEKQGYDEWLGPKALEYERRIKEAYQQKMQHQNDSPPNPITRRQT